jgi:anti-anti-sigma factor
MGMKLKIRKHNAIPVFELSGKLQGGDAIMLSKKLEAFVDKPFDKIVLDLSNIQFIDSNWLGVLIYCLKLYRDKNKEILFYITSEFIKSIFQTSNIYSIATVIETLDGL